MWAALAGLWQCVRNHSNGHAVSLPLAGAGQSGVGVEPMHLLRLILLSILVATREREVSKRINIVRHPDLFEKIDLRGIKKTGAEHGLQKRYLCRLPRRRQLRPDRNRHEVLPLATGVARPRRHRVLARQQPRQGLGGAGFEQARYAGRSLLERLRNSRNILLIIGNTTRLDTDWVPFEIAQAIDTYEIPIIAAYPAYINITNPTAARPLWPAALAQRIDSGKAHVIHIPFRQAPIKHADHYFDAGYSPHSHIAQMSANGSACWQSTLNESMRQGNHAALP